VLHVRDRLADRDVLDAGKTDDIAGGRLLVTFLYGLTPRDPATLLTAIGMLLAAAAAAATLPALRAARVDPNVALRYE